MWLIYLMRRDEMQFYPFKVHFYRSYDLKEIIESNYIIFYLIRGESEIVVSEKPYILKEENFLIVNFNHSYSVRLFRDSLLMKIDIDYQTLCTLANGNTLLFQCYDHGQMNAKYEKFRYRLNELLGEFSIDPTGLNYRKMSKLYSICDYIVHSFVITEVSTPHSEQMGKIKKAFDYVEKNYQKKITLNDAADYLYMVPSSFSRFFSKATGVTFVKYLTKIRLEHALYDLALSDLGVSEIAFKNGFGSVSQFNKQFKQFYKMTPYEFKNKPYVEKTNTGNENEELIDEQLSEDLEKYQNKVRLVVVREQKIHIQEQEIDTLQGKLYYNPWGKLINFGFASRLLSAEYQRQVLFLKQNLNFEYGIINGIFSPEFRLKEKKSDEKLNFVNFDSVLDFFVENNIKPVIIFDNQKFAMIKKLNERGEIQCLDIFEDEEQCINALRDIIDHIIYRYGMREVNSWKFEIWYYELDKTILGLQKNFGEVWDKIYEMIKERISGAQVGGTSLGVSVKYETSLEFYREWRKARHLPDFLTVNLFPYKVADRPGIMEAVRLEVESSFGANLMEFRAILAEAGYPEIPIIALEWNLSFVQRNYFNDMAGKGAIMMAQMIQGLDENIQVGYWPASDLYAGDYDANHILNGACGLISAEGICKPVFYAWKFLLELQNLLVSRGEHYIVTKDGKGFFSVILFNNKKLNYNYYTLPESSIGPQDSKVIFAEEDSLEIKLTLKGIPNKKYLLRKQIIGPEHGSVLDEWMKLGIDLPMSISDMVYLKNRCTPFRKNEEITAENHQLTIMETLESHEIMLVQIM